MTRFAGKDEDLVQVLGYLNFSSGKSDPRTLQALNRLYGWAIAGSAAAKMSASPFTGMPAWVSIQHWLQDRLALLVQEQPAFRENTQGSQVLELVWSKLLPAYLDFHRDLLFHQEPEALLNGFFLGKAIEAVLVQGGPWTEEERIISDAIRHLNDFVGYRPVAVLEGRRLEPYPHEWSRPIPLYVENVGVAFGPYYEIITQTIDILRNTPPDILHASYFELEHLEELAIDARAYDFDHPVNKRPNYHFGQWDPHRIDLHGNYRRFVIQQVTVDALLARIDIEKELPREEVLFEAAAVLAGTMLMASGVSGSGPNTFGSNVTLASLMEPIALNRDRFYEALLSRLTGPHADRLQAEKKIRRQAFGGCRQHLNTQLGRERASQLEHVMLARLFARMGSPAAAKEESDHVQVPSARLQCVIDCLLTTGMRALAIGDLEEASTVLGEVRQWLERGIQCGAIVDPWNIMGFAGNFSRFHGPDSAVHDHRVDELIAVIEDFSGFQSRVWRAAAAANREDICQRVESDFRALASWWRKYAAHQIQDLEATDIKAGVESAELVATALRLWHKGGAATGDVKFWAPHAAMFDSPKAYALVIEALLERQDFVASMALLVHWLSENDRVGLQSGSVSFSDIARLWLETLQRTEYQNDGEPFTSQAKWKLIEKFFDYLEANADWLALAPEFRLGDAKRRTSDRELLGDEEDEEEGSQFESAYENVVYKDSTDDGMEGATFEEDTDTHDELAAESKRLTEHLTFQAALAYMWKQVALNPQLLVDEEESELHGRQLEALERWCVQSASSRRGLIGLVDQIYHYRIARGSADQDSMARYDRKRLIKESLLEKTIASAVDISDAQRLLLALVGSKRSQSQDDSDTWKKMSEEDKLAVRLISHLMAGRRTVIEEEFPKYLAELRNLQLLYLPLARGGDPEQIFAVRLRRRVLTHLLSWLPRQGLYFQSCQLIETARFMEHNHPVGPGAVTEFDELFKMAYKSMVQSLVRNAYAWNAQGQKARRNKSRPNALAMAIDPQVEMDELIDHPEIEPASDSIIPILEQLTEVLLGSWLSHSRTLRLSVLETVDHPNHWKRLVSFIEKYGSGLFTQQFLKLGSVRAILHQGVATWLEQAKEDGDHEEVNPILDAIERGELPAEEAHRCLSIVLETIIDHFTEYRDYNSTTTQSDRGEMIYMLLDFLRLRVRYDRVSWNLKPVFWAHEVLVRSACHQTAASWRRALAERIGREADQYLTQLKKLQEQYAMRMPTVADRLGERFVKPMTIDRLRSLIRPAMRQLAEPDENGNAPSFDLLVEEIRIMTLEPTGVGLDVPPWLESLGEEVDSQPDYPLSKSPKRTMAPVPMIVLTPEEIERQLHAAAFQNRMLH